MCILAATMELGAFTLDANMGSISRANDLGAGSSIVLKARQRKQCKMGVVMCV